MDARPRSPPGPTSPSRLGHRPGGDLVELLALAQSAVTELIDRCEEAGLVRRESLDTDGRVVIVRLTAEGERRFAATVSALRAERAALRAVLGSPARRT
jgi:DNA-binding MarR family transcriptional regulator